MDNELKDILLNEYKELLKNFSGTKEKYITHITNQHVSNPQFEGLAEVLKEGLYAYEMDTTEPTQNTEETQNDTTETTNNNETNTSNTSTSY